GESRSYVGTEGYVPPEGPGTPQADLYGLGKVLYQVGTGQDYLQFPLLPTSLLEQPEAAQLAELNEVYLKACAADPRSRYETAEDLHADLALLHRGRSVRQQHKRHRRLRQITIAGYLAAALAGFLIGVAWSPAYRSRPTPGAHAGVLPKQIPIDLSRFYNARLTTNWLNDFDGNDLSGVPSGWHRFGSAFFDVRGIIQLSGSYLLDHRLVFPAQVQGIPVKRTCARLHFLHGTVWPNVEKDTQIASYVVHYSDGRQEEIPIRYGREVKDWWWNGTDQLNIDSASLAWLGTNRIAGGADAQNRIRLYGFVWQNPHPDTLIDRLDFVSLMSPSCPFLLGVTAE
ncbi:MAG TPA: hypothetical protein VJA21_33780, partial [Verrucomicrobiae bacterium]